MTMSFVEAMETVNRQLREADQRKRQAQAAGDSTGDVMHMAAMRLLALAENADDQVLADTLHDLAHEQMERHA